MTGRVDSFLLNSTRKFVLDLIVKAAVAGERCPQNFEFGDGCDMRGLSHWREAMDQLCLDGEIRREISGRNWRTIHILKGEHAGKMTKPDPMGHAVSQVYDVNGFRRIRV